MTRIKAVILLVVPLLAVLGYSMLSPAVAEPEAPAPTITSRWTIQRAEIGVAGDVGSPPVSAVNTILLDTHTGKTWLLWNRGDETRDYYWKPISRDE